jgi:hypothetical protein
MADIFNAVTYFEAMAEAVNDISTSGGTNHFTQVSSLQELEGFIAEMQSLKGVQLVLMDTLRGKFTDRNADKLINQRFVTFFILKHMADATFQGKNTVISDVKAIGDQIIARMLHHRRNYLHNMHLLNVDSITFEQVGPLGSYWYGLNYSFFIYDYPGDIAYNADNYTEEWQNPS